MAVVPTDNGAAPTPRTLVFEPANHGYWVDGILRESVTQLLDAAGLTPDYSVVQPHVLQHARERGIHVDACCDLIDADDLDWRSVHPEAVPYVEAWMAFKEYEGYTPVAAQIPLYHPVYGYAGTADSIGLLPGGRPVIVERKSTTKMAPTYALQTAGYGLDGLWCAPTGGGELEPVPWGVPARLGVQLLRDGKYRLVPYDDPEDFAAFLGVVALARWRAARRGLPAARRAR